MACYLHWTALLARWVSCNVWRRPQALFVCSRGIRCLALATFSRK